MNCAACGAIPPENALFSEACAKPLSPPSPRGSAYGAIDDRPTSRAFVLAVVCVVVLGLGLVGLWYYHAAELRRLDAMDYGTLNAEHDALKAATEPLEQLAAAAVPETKPDDYLRLSSEAKTAVEQYHQQSKLGIGLPSGRPWPAQFARCAGYLDKALNQYEMVNYYLDLKSKNKSQKPKATAEEDQNVRNLAALGADPLEI